MSINGYIGNLPAAHAGHVIVDLLTVAPVFLLILWFAFITIRDRRAGVDDEKGDPPRT